MSNNSSLFKSVDTMTAPVQVVLVILTSAVITASLLGNGGILIILRRNNKLWNSTYMLIGNLAAVGVALALFSMPFSIAAIIKQGWPFADEICTANGFINSILLLSSIFTHTLISVGRYFAVVRPYSRVMTMSNTKRIIFFIWFIAFLMSIGPLFRFGRFEFGKSSLHCGIGFPKKKVEKIYLYVLIGIGFIIPIVVMGHVYTNVFISVRKHRRRLESGASNITSSSTDGARPDGADIQKRLIKAAISSLACFLFCWTPFSVYAMVALSVKSHDSLPRGLGIAAYLGGFSYSAINPIIIAAICSSFSEGFREICQALTCFRTEPLVYLRGKCGHCHCQLIDNLSGPKKINIAVSKNSLGEDNIDATKKRGEAANDDDLLRKRISNEEYLKVTYL